MKSLKFIFLIFIVVASVFTTHGNDEVGCVYALENLLEEAETNIYALHKDVGDTVACIKNSRRANNNTNNESSQNDPFYFLFLGTTRKPEQKKHINFTPYIAVCRSGEISFLHRFQLF